MTVGTGLSWRKYECHLAEVVGGVMFLLGYFITVTARTGQSSNKPNSESQCAYISVCVTV